MSNQSDNHNHEDPHSDERGTLILYKIMAMTLLSSISILMGISAMLFVKNRNDNENKSTNKVSKIVKVLLSFGGGVLLATTFLHLIPEVREELQEELESRKIWESFGLPATEFLVCFGFFIMYLVEELMHALLRKQETNVTETIATDAKTSANNELVENGHVINISTTNHSHNHNHDHSHHHGHSHHGHSHIPIVMLGDKNNHLISSLKGLMIVFGLSVHELFEGLTIGLMHNETDVWQMALAVATHKFVIAFCIGVQLTTIPINRWLSIIYVCAFAIVSPIGIGIGLVMVEEDSKNPNNSIIRLLLQAVATGTLLYVIFFEILKHRHGFKQFLSIVGGFGVMAVIQNFFGHTHEHHHHH